MIGQILSLIRKSDIMIEVIDSREPDLTRSKRLEEYAITRRKKVLIVINKADLVPREIAEGWKRGSIYISN